MLQMGITTLLTTIIIMKMTTIQNRGADNLKGIDFSKNLFKKSTLLKMGGAITICILITVLLCLF